MSSTATHTDDDLMTVPDVLHVLRPLSKRTFYRWRETGKAPICIRLPNGELRIHRSDFKEWLDSHREQVAA
ncbi:putative DNA-binding transcriptional regulator AlpA [Allocatelliglobosispora scoriae]|uniref:Putative DNA-binding transcriptional regulator AlpA n=1 Tax=Allocatelliglobosispora scoriae TaxID=643052 RepID=A0A841BS96_9ACTN|nr:helix-turn-helix domain-containing protein [Allocatelliglobosispora scoriae]MBB5870575.1 putative DNA-binding transcriptional regulator AlpA [Allocatelliglobosispora scoriae]